MRPTTVSLLCLLLVTSVFAQSPNPRENENDRGPMPAFSFEPHLSDAGNGALVGEGAAYRASLLPTGVRFEVATRPGLPGPRLDLRFAGAFRNGLPASGSDAVLPTASGLMGSYDRGALRERYQVRAGSIEQSFEIPEPLPGSGDLAISFDVDGNVTAPAWDAPRHGAVEFSLDGERAVRYGEAYGIERGGKRIEIETRWNGSRLELIVPASFLDGGNYPLLIDPAIGPVFLPGGSASNDVNPDVAHDPELKTWLVVWQRVYSTDSDIRARLYDEDGNPLSPIAGLESSASVDAREPAVAFYRGNGNLNLNRFLVVWSEGAVGSATYRIRGRLVVAANGSLTGNTFDISLPVIGDKDRRPSVSGGPPMLVAWERTPAGASSSRSIRFRTINWANPSVASGVTLEYEYTLVTVNPTSGYVANVSLAQSSLTTTIAGAPWQVWRATWQRFYNSPAPGDADIFTALFRTRSGAVQDYSLTSLASVPNANTVGVNEINPDVAVLAANDTDVGGARYLLAWEEDGDIFGQRYGTSGTVGGTIAIDDSSAGEYLPAVGAGTCEFTVAYLRAGTGEFNFDVRAAAVLPDGTVPVNGRLIDDPGTVYQDDIRASSRPLLSSNATTQRNTSLIAWTGQTGTSGTSGLNDVRARFFEPLAASVNPFGTGCPGPGGATPTIGYSGGLPHPGNLDFAITLTGAPPSSLAILVIGETFANDPIPGAPGCTAYVGPNYTYFQVLTTPSGTAAIPLPIPCVPYLAGVTVACQWAVAVPGFNPAGAIVSDDIDVSWFR